MDYNVYCQSSGSGSISANHQLYFELNGNIIKNENVYVNVKSPNAYIAIASGTLEVSHNDDGSKEIWVGASISATGGYGVSASVGTLFTLSTIPRASSVSCTTANIEETAIINVSSASSNFRHNITASFGSETMSIASNIAGGTMSWTLPSSFYEQIPNSKTGTGKITCDTYNNGSYIGSKTTTLNVTTSEEKCRPSLSAIVVDSNDKTIALTGNNEQLIKYESDAKIDIVTEAKNKAKISTKKVNNTTISGTSITIQKIETDTFNIIVTDSRGYSNSVILKPTVIDYIPLTINATIKRTQPTTGEVDITFSGNYFNENFGSVNNTLNINWKYKESGSLEWIDGGDLTATINNNTYSNGNTAISLGNMFNYQKSYNFMLEVTDKLTTLQPTYTVTQGIPIFNWGKDFFSINGDLKVLGKIFANKSMITVNADRQFINIPNNWDRAEIPLKNSTNLGNKLELVDGAVKIGEGVTKVLVSVHCDGICFEVDGDKILKIINNDLDIGTAYQGGNTNVRWRDASIPPKLINVKTGDLIRVIISSGTAGDVEILGCYLTVEVVE